ncbi:MAG: lytic transglycosylase domain-containing protein [Bacteroidales bacterium]
MKADKSRRIMSGRRWIIPLTIIILSVIGVFTIGKISFGGTTDPEPVEPVDKTYYGIFPFEVPEKLDFAGEKVPLEYFDVKESLDRELLSNTFFHSQTILMIKLSNRYFPLIEPILKEQGVPDDFKYLVIAESNLSNAVSPAGAVGFWQIRKGTGIEYGLEINSEVDERYHLEKSTVVACKYLKESFEKYKNWTMSAASYNAGRRGMDRQITRQKEERYYDLLLNDETARYLFRVLAFKLILEDPAAYGFHISNRDVYHPVPYRVVTINAPVDDFADFAKEHQTNYKLLKFFNPWLRENNLTNSSGKAYEIMIPEENAREMQK